MSKAATGLIFNSKAHEEFYYKKLIEVRYQDAYHKALVYCLGINSDTRKYIDRIYDFKTGCVKTECLKEGWQTSGSKKVVRMAFNLYCNGTPSVYDYKDEAEQVDECREYAPDELFCCNYAPFFWQAVQIRYPEYVNQLEIEKEKNIMKERFEKRMLAYAVLLSRLLQNKNMGERSGKKDQVVKLSDNRP